MLKYDLNDTLSTHYFYLRFILEAIKIFRTECSGSSKIPVVLKKDIIYVWDGVR